MPDDTYLAILEHNQGFDDARAWLEYAETHSFRQVKATKRTTCPDCGTPDAAPIGQYVYYSNLAHLRQCRSCGLMFSDVLLAPEVIKRHFEATYNDETYFRRERRDIFRQIAAIIRDHVRYDGRVIDIGGAKGHLMELARKRRPDIHVTINDLSQCSCNYARETYGFDTLCCPMEDLRSVPEHFDAALLIDVIYCPPEIRRTWEAIDHLVDKGLILIRIPNKLWLLKTGLLVRKWLRRGDERVKQDRIDFFNPEHVYLFTRAYMRRRLNGLGFRRVRFLPSRFLLKSDRRRLLCSLAFTGAMLIHYLSFRRLILTPSMLIMAEK
ncbi:MAG: class I SAM-dependent methyltransferase [Armatimonadetes bacterium]|nr:class I SAM-dependent methyltransferase [Armatimonadota bacterium]